MEFSVAALFEFKKYIQFFFDYYLKKFGEEPVILPAIYEIENIEIDLVVGESSGKIFGIRYYINANDNSEESIPEEINLLEDDSIEEDQIDQELIEDTEDEEDVVWDFSYITEKTINGKSILSFIFRFDDYFNQSEIDSDENEIDTSKIPKEKWDEIVKSNESDVKIKDPIIKVEIFAAKGRPIGASVKRYDDQNQKDDNLIGNYILDSELFRRQIFF